MPSKKHILFSFFLLISLQAFTQGGWKKKYALQNSLSSVCRNVIEAPNGNFIMIGLTYDTIHNPGTNRLTIVGTDASGNMLWRKDYGRHTFEYLDNLLAPEGAVVYDQNYFYHTLGVRDSNNKYIGVLLKFDYNGDTLWQRIYRDPNQDVIPQGICKSVDGGFIITGSFQNWINNTNPVLLLKTNISGYELWRKAINKAPPNVHDGHSPVQDSATKRIVVVGYQYIGPNSDTHSSILILDSLGNTLTQTTFNNAGGGGFGKVIQLKDKNFVTCGGYNMNSDLGIHPRLKSLVVKFDTNANVIWSKTYDTLSLYTGVGCLNELPNGDIMMGGNLDTLRNYNISATIKLRVIRTDKDGNVKWKKYVGSAYTHTLSEYMRSMSPTNDKGFIISSWLYFQNNLPPYSIVKIDSTGCDTLEAHCKLIDALGLSDLYRVRGYDMELFPNPAKGFVNVKVGGGQNKAFRIKIIDASGREVYVSEIKGEEGFVLNTSDFAQGIYVISLEQNQRVIQNRKLVIMK